MKHLGIEIEFTGVTRRQVCVALENLFETKAETEVGSKSDNPYFKYKITDTEGFVWSILRDRSIKAEPFDTDTSYCCELVSPVLTSETLPTLFTVVDIIKSLGGVVNNACGIHIHIDKPDSFEEILGLFKKFIYSQDEIVSYYNIEGYRLKKYCRMYEDFDLDKSFYSLEELFDYLSKKYLNEDDTLRQLRYFGLNIYSILDNNTMEFRIFNSSLDKSQIAKYIDWVLHFCYSVSDFDDYIPYLGKILYEVM